MAVANDRGLYAPQSPAFIQGFDTSSLSRYDFLLDNQIFCNSNTFAFDSSDFSFHEPRPLITFKPSGADRQPSMYSPPVLSFDRDLDYGENRVSWLDSMEEDIHAIDRITSKNRAANWFGNEGDGVGKMKGFNRGANLMDCGMRASKKYGVGIKRQAKAKMSSAKDVQSVAAKNRRERISERLKTLQALIPNGTKVDLVTMLEKAISYVKFLQLQVKVLAADEFWPAEGEKAAEISQVKEAIDAILSSHRERNLSSS